MFTRFSKIFRRESSNIAEPVASSANNRTRSLRQGATDFFQQSRKSSKQLKKELSSYKEEKPWREKQSMAEAELSDNETATDDSEESSTKENIADRKKQPMGQEKPRRPFD